MRHDLLSLSADDLASISNRGNVNRATRELDRGKVRGEVTETNGTVSVVWSDGPTTTIAADTIVADAQCTCPAASVCRHIVRTVLAYQRWAATQADEPEAPDGPWDPGTVADEQLADLFRGASIARWTTTFEQDPGLVVELVRSSRPTARFHRLGHTIRFLVPGDARYTRCDCDDPSPCKHVALAVWAFRQLDPALTSGVVETAGPQGPVHADSLDELLQSMLRLVDEGLAETPQARADRLRALERRLRQDGLLWPADALHELVKEWTHYHEHDARFSPARVAELVGELVIRHDALSAPEIAVPRLFVRGEESVGKTTLGQTKLVGLGTVAVARHGAVELIAILQDTKSGKVMSFGETFPDPPPGSPRRTESFAELARKPVVDRRDLATMGRSQVVVKSVRLEPNHTLSFGRSATSAYGQDFNWENLLAPVFCESIAEMSARIQAQPPASLRPRRPGETLVVLPVAECIGARFDTRTQALRATLLDEAGDSVDLVHPYSDRGKTGLERALQWLRGSAKLLFVAARGRTTATGLELSPTSLVFEDGARRVMIQPWIDDMDDHLERSSVSIDGLVGEGDALDRYRDRLQSALGSALVVGRTGHDSNEFRGLATAASQLGMTSHAGALERLADQFDAESLLEILVASKLAQQLV